MSNRFPVIYDCVSPLNHDEAGGGKMTTRLRKSVTTGLHLAVCHLPTECVFGHFMFLTKTSSEKPLAAVVQRLTMCGSQYFREDFVQQLGRKINAYTGTVLCAERSVFTINTANDRTLIAMLPPFLDALFFPTMTEEAYNTHVYASNEQRRRRKGNMYRDLMDFCSFGNRHVNIDKLIYPPGNPYRCDLNGSAEVLAQLDPKEVRAYHQHYYRPSNCFIVLAGDINESDFLSMMRAFEDGLPSDLVADALKYPAKLACPVVAPTLARPDLFCLMNLPDDIAAQELNNQRRSSSEMRPGLRVRFVSEINDKCRDQVKKKKVPQVVHLHLICQGPDIFHNQSLAAFTLLAHKFKDLISQGPWDRVDISIKDRKWPLACFVIRTLWLDQVDTAHKSYEDIVNSFLDCPKADAGQFIASLIDNAIDNYRDELEWRGDYNAVTALSQWLSCCSLSAPGAKESFMAACQPLTNIKSLRHQSLDWWRDNARSWFGDPIMILEPTENGPVSPTRITDPGNSSVFSMSSMTSNAIPDDIGIGEQDWAEQKDVMKYIKSIGGREACFLLNQISKTTDRPSLEPTISQNSRNSDRAPEVRV